MFLSPAACQCDQSLAPLRSEKAPILATLPPPSRVSFSFVVVLIVFWSREEIFFACLVPEAPSQPPLPVVRGEGPEVCAVPRVVERVSRRALVAADLQPVRLLLRAQTEVLVLSVSG